MDSEAMVWDAPDGWDEEVPADDGDVSEMDEPMDWGEPAPFAPSYDDAIAEADERRGWR